MSAPPARSPPATSPGGSSRPTTTPRSAGSALALNAMLEPDRGGVRRARTASEERLRRFVADASHELRTPLTSIRGYAELFRRGAAERPEDLAKAMRRIEDEAARMGVLVDDLLLLARLDQGRPLEPAPVDLWRVAADAVADARGRRPRPARSPSSVPTRPVVVAATRPACARWSPTCSPTRAPTRPPGTGVHVRRRGRRRPGGARGRRRGPGLRPSEARARLRALLPGRRRRARTAPAAGAGLGLSIVAAIVAAHGGTRATPAPHPAVVAPTSWSLCPLPLRRYPHPQQSRQDGPAGRRTTPRNLGLATHTADRLAPIRRIYGLGDNPYLSGVLNTGRGSGGGMAGQTGGRQPGPLFGGPAPGLGVRPGVLRRLVLGLAAPAVVVLGAVAWRVPGRAPATTGCGPCSSPGPSAACRNIGYDLFRVPSSPPGYGSSPPSTPMACCSSTATRRAPCPGFAGWAYHFSNGIGFGIAYAAVALGRRAGGGASGGPWSSKRPPS